MTPEPWDYVWITCIILVNVLLFLRKGILAKHGHVTPYIDLKLRDRQLLRELADSSESPTVRMLYHLVNIGIPVLFIIGVVVLVVYRAISQTP